MTLDEAERFYSERVLEELGLAGFSDDPELKKRHLNTAARFATLRELITPPHYREQPA